MALVPTAGSQFNTAMNRLVQQENRLVMATSVAAPPKSATYAYDGEGRRVKRIVGTDTTVYVYDASGQLAQEYASLPSDSGTQYLTADHLGSTRLTTDSSGAIAKCYDYLPFGEELTIGRPSCFVPSGGHQVYPPVDKQTVKFTGKERDPNPRPNPKLSPWVTPGETR